MNTSTDTAVTTAPTSRSATGREPEPAPGRLEHINMTVSDPRRTATMLVEVFGWRIRWEGEALGNGSTVHVGTDDSYVALYAPSAGVAQASRPDAADTYRLHGGLNHVAVVVDDLDAVEQRVVAAGLVVHSRYDYQPGRRFYFDDHDGIEFEVVAYG